MPPASAATPQAAAQRRHRDQRRSGCDRRRRVERHHHFTIIKAQGANGSAAIDAEPVPELHAERCRLVPAPIGHRNRDRRRSGTTDQIVSITVNNVDDAASISGDTSGSGNEGTVISGDLDATDADGLSDGSYFTIRRRANGSAAIDAEPVPGAQTPS